MGRPRERNPPAAGRSKVTYVLKKDGDYHNLTVHAGLQAGLQAMCGGLSR
jgi:hypothetical protein